MKLLYFDFGVLTMWFVVVKFVLLILLTSSRRVGGTKCTPRWFDCGNGKCIAEIWHCDGENDCGNFNDEKECENLPAQSVCLSSQFKCKSEDQHCIPEKWRCDGEKDCRDGSDEIECNVSKEICPGFTCHNPKCIPDKWRCDGNKDCDDGSDEELCPQSQLCNDSEFLCSSGSCILQQLVCNGKKDCGDGSDEGPHCGDPCENATCSQNCKSTPTGPQCYCNDGYALDSKDNKTCNDVNECQQVGFCSHDCTNTEGGYTCSCQDGYELVNRTCLAAGADPLLIYSTGKEVRGISLRSKEYFPVASAVVHISAVDVDPKSQMVYWIDISYKSTIYAAKTNGSGLRSVLSHGLLLPEDIAVDYIANNLYITDSGLRQVLACKADGRMCHVLHANSEKPRSIALDPDSRLMYWSDWGEHSPGIYRSGMDGSRRISMVSSRIGWPNGIALDHTTSRLYWVDAKLHTVEYITLDGTHRSVLLNTTVFHPYSLAIFEDTLYWSDLKSFSLESCDKFTGHKVTIAARQSNRKIMGVHVYHPVLTSKATNPCWSNDCSHMCLMSPVKEYSCACPHGFVLSNDQKTCINEQGESIFVSEGSRVFYISPKMVGSESVTELPLGLRSAMITRVAYDSKLRYMFVADSKKPAIYVVNMTSLNMQELVGNDITSPEDLAFDWKSNNLYWIDRTKGTAEIMNINLLRRVVILNDLQTPIALAISPAQGFMFIASVGSRYPVSRYDMDGKNRKVLQSVMGLPLSLALHPSKTILYWTDLTETISYVNYTSNLDPQIMKTKLNGGMSVSASEEYIYWTSSKRELNLLKGDVEQVLPLPGQSRGDVDRKVTYSPGVITAGLSMCLVGNGGCSYVCLTSPEGRTCACSSEMILSSDNVTCVARECNTADFQCVNGHCLPADKRCDGSKDCTDGSDEVGCSSRCSADDFQCKNGRCILRSWRCDARDDCGDNSDEINCPVNCSSDEINCLDGSCIAMLWRCDGEKNCPDGSDEINCDVTRCNDDTHMRCGNGQCVPLSWKCDGTIDCFDGSDERNCKCEANDFRCVNGQCLSIEKRCDRTEDCADGSDEVGCTCDGFFCSATSLCLPWSKVCDGKEDCSFMSDEGELCSTSCADGKINCSDICRKTPQGPKCFCDKGFRLLDDNETCGDVNECHEFGTCSHVCSNRKGSYKCSCVDGYKLKDDNRSCAAEGESPTLMYILDDVIRGIDLETYLSKVYFTEKGATMRGFDYDIDEKVFYWTDLNSESINSYSVRNNSHDVIYRSCSRPVAVRYDWVAKNLYFLDEKSNIGVCTRNGKICKILTKSGGRRIDSMAISPPFGYMFWTIWSSSFQRNRSGVIRRAEMDGSHVVNIVSSEILSPTVITVDPVLKLVYWADMELKTMECANFNGFKRRQIVKSGVHHPVATVVFEDYVYWSEWNTSTIMRCHKFIKGRCENIIDGNVKAHDILVTHKVMQPGRNSSLCLAENGGCSHLCLTARKRRTCTCSDSMTLDVDRRTCLASKCSKNEFRCNDVLCIAEDLKCDGRQQCNDGSDEVNCSRHV